jgi:hypothetical protein
VAGGQRAGTCQAPFFPEKSGCTIIDQALLEIWACLRPNLGPKKDNCSLLHPLNGKKELTQVHLANVQIELLQKYFQLN